MTNLIRFSPHTEMRHLQREIDSLFENIFPVRNSDNTDSVAWSPRVDLSETEDAYIVHADVPGMKKDEIEINYQDGTLTVSGERRMEETQEDKKFVRVERSYGRFYRAFTLPQTVRTQDITADFEDGVLTIVVPKAEESKPRRIEIR